MRTPPVLVRELPGTTAAHRVLRRLAERATGRGLPPPAALSGDWFGAAAVLAPSVRVDAGVAPPTSSIPDEPRAPGGPVGGGWIGYLGYGHTDPLPAARRLPVVAGGYTDHVLRLDRDGRWWFESLGEPPPGLVDDLAALVATDVDPAPGTVHVGPWTRPDPDAHRKAVQRVITEIGAGEVYQVNVCTRFEADFTGDPLDVAARGIATLGARRTAALAGSWGAVVSFSPELFLARHGRRVRTEPIKGTARRRGPTDDPLAAALLASAKDVAENVMIVDMARNDLGRVSTIGSVSVPTLLAVEPHPGVWHLVSTVEATLADGIDDRALLAATFPPASVTGTPKHRALEVIADVETVPREGYCGAIGMVSPVAGTELNVAIRTCEFASGRVWFGVGGGITADSDPDAEWAECLTKAAPLLAVLDG